MARSTVHYADSDTNNILKRLHNKLRPAGTPVQRVEYIIELLLLRVFEVKLKHDPEFVALRGLFGEPNEELVFSSLYTVPNDRLLPTLNEKFFPFYARILSEARRVYETNLPQKVQDQLVLIEEVFKNSNFTNNVKSGNLHEIIGLIGEIDQERLLGTDLLGDAIESALSETGGTKDIGLHRTPDHIRQFMVGLVEPTFRDIIFDPACGTAGFLFDSFGYVMESVRKDGRWPGGKAHPEIRAHFRKFFSKKRVEMPSQEEAITFYRTGISGIEYLGMIRKMAAINFYVRGLNPQNIEQGDSLAMFEPARDAGTKSVVLANPPFGAERDQEAYPNVWEEFPREAETTILFVKLMYDALAANGRCAVIVSEGFMTWDQASARNLRKMLLENAQLKAVISLPLGVFISKSGPGPKTSILVFDKNGPTKNVWLYRVTNDGYTLGTNRRPVKGCQLVEALEIFHQYVSKGLEPPRSENSFSIPSEWILRLDPRIKDRIREKTRQECAIKALQEKRQIEAGLAKQEKEGKIAEEERKRRLDELNLVWEQKTLNEIAKRIEKERLYSFNLQEYVSSLSENQLRDWADVLGPPSQNDDSELERLYGGLQTRHNGKTLTTVRALNPRSSLEFDLLREFLNGPHSGEELEGEQLPQLRKIIEGGSKYPRVYLGDYVRERRDKFRPAEEAETLYRVLGVSNAGGVFLNEIKRGSDIKQAYHRVQYEDFCYNPYRINVGSIGLNRHQYENQIVSGAYNVFYVHNSELLPDYLALLLESDCFIAYVNDKASGGVRMNFKMEFLSKWEIPLPPPDVQRELADRMGGICELTKSLKAVVDYWQSDTYLDLDAPLEEMGKLCSISSRVTKDLNGQEEVAYVGGEHIIPNVGIVDSKKTVGELGIKGPAYTFQAGQVIYNKIRPYLRKCFLAKEGGICSSDMYPLDVNKEKVTPEYLLLLLLSNHFARKARRYDKRAGIPKINRKKLFAIKVPVPDLERQRELSRMYLEHAAVLGGVLKMIPNNQQQLAKIMNSIWSVSDG